MGKSLSQIAAASTQCKLGLQFFLPEVPQTDVDGVVFTAGTGSRRRPYPWQEQSTHKRREVVHHSHFSPFTSGKMPAEVLDLPRE